MAWKIIGCCFSVFMIAYGSAPQLWRDRRWKELALFSVVLALSAAFMIAVWLHVRFPSPLVWIDRAVQAAGG